MSSATLKRRVTRHRMILAGREVEYRIVRSPSAKRLRLRVGVDGVSIIQPKTRSTQDLDEFLHDNSEWLHGQLARVDRFRSIRRPSRQERGLLLFRGEETSVQVKIRRHYGGSARVNHVDGRILIERSAQSSTPAHVSLENWLRRQARNAIHDELGRVCGKLNRQPHKVFVMGQRTKWGNCSALHNLSFNWRLVMAPDFVLRYLVTHEAVHLAIPDHSKKFWLTVRSLCPEAERAKQWLCANSPRLLADLCIGGIA